MSHFDTDCNAESAYQFTPYAVPKPMPAPQKNIFVRVMMAATGRRKLTLLEARLALLLKMSLAWIQMNRRKSSFICEPINKSNFRIIA